MIARLHRSRRRRRSDRLLIAIIWCMLGLFVGLPVSLFLILVLRAL